MFFKLLKYDLKSMLKTMIPLWITVIIISIILGLQIMHGDSAPMSSSFLIFGGGVLMLILIAVFVAIFVINLILVLQRFWKGLLGDEGYLMFTLPVSVRKLILSKVAGASIAFLASIIAALICGSILLICSYFVIKDDISIMNYITFYGDFFNDIGSDNILLGAVFYLLNGLSNIYQMYAAMSIGHLSNKNRFFCSFIAYVGISCVVSMIASPFTIFIDKIQTADITFNMIMITSIIVSIIKIIVYHIITEYILTRRLNLE